DSLLRLPPGGKEKRQHMLASSGSGVGNQPSTLAQPSTSSAPHLAFHSFRVLWLPPLVSMTSLVCGLRYCLTLRARLAAGALRPAPRLVRCCAEAGSRMAMMSSSDLPYWPIRSRSFFSNSISFCSFSSCCSAFRRSCSSLMASSVARNSEIRDMIFPLGSESGLVPRMIVTVIRQVNSMCMGNTSLAARTSHYRKAIRGDAFEQLVVSLNEAVITAEYGGPL